MAEQTTTELQTGWKIQDESKLRTTSGTEISTNSFSTSGWYNIAKMPSTAFAALVENDVYKNVYFGQNLKSVPNLSDKKWWYRTTFPAPGGQNKYWLIIKGITSCGDVYLNGTLIASSSLVRGVHNKFEFDVTNQINPDGANTLALCIWRGKSNFGSWEWVDWSPYPPDRVLGIWNKIFLKTTGNIEVRNPCVLSYLPLPATNYADLTVTADIVNGTSTSRSGYLAGNVAGITFSQAVSLNANEQKTVTLSPIRLNNPKLWWPNGFGEPNLYPLNIRFTENGVTSDSQSIKFGIRKFEKYLSSKIHGYQWFGLKVNGKDVLVRGAAYRPDMTLKFDDRKEEAEVRYWKDMGWNAVRFEGSMGNEHIYDLCDQYGIMLEPGWCCCSAWEDIKDTWSSDKMAEAEQMMRATSLSLRHHAATAVFSLGSDLKIGKGALDMYHWVLSEVQWTADKVIVDHSGFWAPGNKEEFSSGIHMKGPYDASTPLMWWQDTIEGAIGSCAEHSAGGCIPMLESVQKFIPLDSIWPLDGNNADVRFHTNYKNLNMQRDMINGRYGSSVSSTRFFDIKAQLFNYEQVRAQYEAFGAKKFSEAFHSIFWMGNNAWPGFKWQLYDYYLKPTGGYFGFKKATQPLAIVYDLSTYDVIIVNSSLNSYRGLKAYATFYNISTTGAVTQQGPIVSNTRLSVDENTHVKIFNLSQNMAGLSTIYFLRLKLMDSANNPVADNLYWYSTKKDINELTYTSHHVKLYTQLADLTGLDNLQTNDRVKISTSGSVSRGQETVNIKIQNNSSSNIAFFLRVEITKGDNGAEILPTIYSDNCISLWPGESKTIAASYAIRDLGGQGAWVRLIGQNVNAINQVVVFGKNVINKNP
ncbi:MAG: hypothetical protein WCK18_09340 [Prolixibacteraceae bacterium]